MRVVGAHQLDAFFVGYFDEHFVHLLLLGVGLMVGVGDSGLVALELQVVVIAKHTVIPVNHLACTLNVAMHDALWHFAAQACRAAYYALVMCGNVVVVGAGMTVETFGPPLRHNLHQVVIPLGILGQQDEVTANVVLVGVGMHVFVGNIYLAAKDGLENLTFLGLNIAFKFCYGLVTCIFFAFFFLELFLQFLNSLGYSRVLAVYVVVQLLDAKHVAMVGQRHSFHPVGNSLVDHAFHRCLAVKNRVLRMHVQVYKWYHIIVYREYILCKNL